MAPDSPLGRQDLVLSGLIGLVAAFLPGEYGFVVLSSPDFAAGPRGFNLLFVSAAGLD